jgi:large subunit ribosomal protein L29
MRASDLREMTDAELQAQLDDAKEEYFNLRFQRASGQLEDFSRLRMIRRDIARIKTVIRERELEAEAYGE